MKINKKICAAFLSASMTISLLTGCSSADKDAIRETSENFLSIVVSGTTDNIEKYASDSVSNGQFVRTFDSAYLSQKFKDGFASDEIDADTSAKVDSFCELFSSMVTGYEIKEVTVDKNGVGTVTATIDTAFPINVIDNDEAVSKMNTITETYATEKADEIQALYEEHTDEEVEAIVYNDMIVEILDMYEGLIQKYGFNAFENRFVLSKLTFETYLGDRKVLSAPESNLPKPVHFALVTLIYLDPALSVRGNLGYSGHNYIYYSGGVLFIEMAANIFWITLSTLIGMIWFKKRELH